MSIYTFDHLLQKIVWFSSGDTKIRLACLNSKLYPNIRIEDKSLRDVVENKLKCGVYGSSIIMAKYYLTDFEPLSIFNCSCDNGHLDVAKWLYATFNLTAEDARSEDNYALRYSCIWGHLDVAKWLHTTFNLTAEDARSDNNSALRYSCSNGHLDVAKWASCHF